jgi:predicted branched-subunit amino acid permease
MAIDARTMRAAVGDALPVFIPAIPFALVVGFAIKSSGLSLFLGWTSSPVIYGGAAQLTLITLLGEGAAVAAAVTAALIVNARHLMYSAAMAPTFQQQPAWFRWVGPYFLIDQVFALCMLRINDDPRTFRTYYLGVGVTFWSLWLITTAAALIIGPAIPAHWGIGFAVPILFLGLLVMGIDRWPKAAAALLAAVTALLAADLPNRSGLLVGALTGVVAGMLLDRGQQ